MENFTFNGKEYTVIATKENTHTHLFKGATEIVLLGTLKRNSKLAKTVYEAARNTETNLRYSPVKSYAITNSIEILQDIEGFKKHGWELKVKETLFY